MANNNNANVPLYQRTKKLMGLFNWVSAGVMVFCMALICCDVFCRYVLLRPIQGATETCAMLMAWIAYSCLAYGLLNGSHMQLGTIYDKLSGRKGHIIALIIYLIGFLLFCTFIPASWKLFRASFAVMEKATSAATVYIWIGKFGVVVGWVLLAVQALLMVIYCIGGIKNPSLPMIGHKSDLDEALNSGGAVVVDEQS